MKQWQRPIQVYCKKCKEWIDESTTTFLDIEEDFQGHDVLTFLCPVCKTQQKSKRIG